MTTYLSQSKRTPHVFASVADFERWESKRKNSHNYEFVLGRILKKRPMKQNELFFVQFLMRQFARTNEYANGAELVSEIDVYIDEYRKRVPDLAYFTAEQIQATRKGEKVVPPFVIEILSDSESFTDVETKIQDYFDAHVQNVWYINPKGKSIHAYTSPKNVQICSGDDVCSASPAIPDFRFAVEELFV